MGQRDTSSPVVAGTAVDNEHMAGRVRARVLVVEDSRTQADWITSLLEREGHVVLVARDGQEALDLPALQTVDIVLSDVEMPRIDGFELCRRMKASPALRSIPFVIVTQHDRVTDLIRALEVGADNFLTKPLTAAAVVSRVRHIMTAVFEGRARMAAQRHQIGIPPDEMLLSFERGQLVEMLMTSAQQLETELAIVGELGLVLTTTRDLAGVLTLLATRARELSDAVVTLVVMRAGDRMWEVREIAAADAELDRRIVGARFESQLSPERISALAAGEAIRLKPREVSLDAMRELYAEVGVSEIYVFPMRVAEQLTGGIALGFPDGRALSANEQRRFRVLSLLGAVAIDNARLFEHERELRERLERALVDVREAHKNAMFMLAAAVEARDGLTGSHLRRVQTYAVALGRALGLAEEQLEELEYSSVMHDVGKLLVPDAILGKPGTLTEDEWVEVRRHPEHGARILGDRQFFTMAREIAYCHHERWDGTGYPRGLKGEEIPISARITSVADVFDALTTRRSYKEAWSEEDAMAELKRLSGQAFDPAVVAEFERLWRSGDVGRMRAAIGEPDAEPTSGAESP